MSSAYMSTLINYWGTLSENSMKRAQAAATLIQAGTYEPKHLFSDVLGFWMDGVEGWWSSLLLSASAPVPVCFLPVAAQQEHAKGEVTVFLPDGTVPEWTSLMTGGGAEIKADQMAVTPQGLTALIVDVEDVKTVAAGLYQGLTFAKDRPLAHILLLKQ